MGGAVFPNKPESETQEGVKNLNDMLNPMEIEAAHGN